MPARRVTSKGVAAALSLLGLSLLASTAHAGVGTGGGTSGTGKVNAFASSAGTVTGGGTASGGRPARPVCRWRLHLGTVAAINVTGGTASYRDASTKQHVEQPGPRVQALYRVECPTGVSYRWATPSEYVDRQALIAAAYAYVVRDIPVPNLNMSPRPDVGSVVNLGLWLAVDDPGEVNALAEAGAVWAAVTARFRGMTWDFGNGDIVRCDGLGVPYPEGSNQISPGPCGYTYTERPPRDGYTVTVTGHWEVQLVTSDGVNQMLDPIDRPYSFAYDVDEIITTVVR